MLAEGGGKCSAAHYEAGSHHAQRGKLENSLGNKRKVVKGSNYSGVNLKDRGFAREHLRALGNQAGKAWWVRRTLGGAATDGSVLFLSFLRAIVI